MLDLDPGRPRCPWAASDPTLLRYHDEEWGRPVRGDVPLFERITLEAFQSGLSWLVILRKREAFREAFAGFEIERVAAFDARDRDRLLADSGIVRNARKIDAAIANARALSALRAGRGDGALDALIWSHAPEAAPRPADASAVPGQSDASRALAAALRGIGLVGIGPTTMHAAMQACGLVDEHVADCWVPGREGS